jgi:hypothetical protein
MFRFDQRVSRKVTSQLLDMAEEGVIDWESLARDALGWMSEDEVAEFARRNDYIQDEEDDLDEEDDDGMTMEDRARRDGRGGDDD